MLVDGPNSTTAEMSGDSTVVTTMAATQSQDEIIEIPAQPGMLVGSPGGGHQQQQSGHQSLDIYPEDSKDIEEACPVCGSKVSNHHYGLVSCDSCKGFFKRSKKMSAPGQGLVPAGPLEVYPHDPPDTKEGIEELCPVCGDKVSGYHYGLLTCESCKGFFKRTVQNKKVYTCVADRSCHIDKSQRKRCPYCRFQKCLDVGMKLEAVRADRMRGGRNKFGPMYKRDRARKLQMMRQKQIQRAQCQGPGLSSEAYQPPFPPSLDPHVKQELIQIPQLSSSTSPDSSPSPLCAGVAPPPHFVPAQSALSGPPVEPLSKATGWGGGARGGCASPGIGAEPQKGAPPPPPQQTQQFQTYDDTNTALSGPPLFVGGAKLPPLVKEFQLSMAGDKEWQAQLFGLLQNQTYNQCEVDVFELMCKVIDQSLFAQVDWARNGVFFKELKVDDQMKLLQHSWSDMLILDHLHQRLHNGLPEEITMPNGQMFSLLQLALLGVQASLDQLQAVAARLQLLKFDPTDYICLKFLLLMNPGYYRDLLSQNPSAEARTLSNMKLVHEAHERTQQALMEYTLMSCPQITDKFSSLLAILPDIHVISERGEDYLLYRHLNGSAPPQTLLMEMLHAKKKQ